MGNTVINFNNPFSFKLSNIFIKIYLFLIFESILLLLILLFNSAFIFWKKIYQKYFRGNIMNYKIFKNKMAE